MSRFAVFVDAGFLLAWGAGRTVGAGAPRLAVASNYGQLVSAILGQCRPHLAGEDLLRLYWYDGAKDQVATPEQVTIGLLDNVKVRLGRLTPEGQKGVDTLIVLDLTTLARERAIQTAFVLSGDEDLREGVLVAQQLGVRILLLGLVSIPGSHQAASLIREADRIVDITSMVEPCFSHVQTQPYLAGQAFGQNFVATNQAAIAGLSMLKAQGNLIIPKPDDAQLLTHLRGALAPQPLVQPLSKLLPWQVREGRRGFWDQIP